MPLDLNQLSGVPFQDGVDVTNLPAQMGQSEPPPQPGPFRFALPATLTLANFDVIAADKTKGQGDRVKVQFNDQAPLLIVQAHAQAADRVNTPFKTSLTNTPRKRGKKDDINAPMASDWDYLNQGLAHAQRPVGNRGYVQQLLTDAGAQKQFGADIEWSWSCNEERDARFPDGQGGTREMPLPTGGNQKGCGERYYQQDVDKVNGMFPLNIGCGKCSAQLRAFGNLTRFKA